MENFDLKSLLDKKVSRNDALHKHDNTNKKLVKGFR